MEVYNLGTQLSGQTGGAASGDSAKHRTPAPDRPVFDSPPRGTLLPLFSVLIECLFCVVTLAGPVCASICVLERKYNSAVYFGDRSSLWLARF
ncbi:hypothetical protein J6590_070766 [Homalodisca vitripennis]|nr:hypothetical protein J6590_070766 [Homalodisca vitripennis]